MKVGTFEEAARFGDIAVLAVKGTAAEAIVRACAPRARGQDPDRDDELHRRGPPVDGVLQYFTGPNESLMERLQRLAPEAHFVKAFSCVGNALMVNPQLPGGKPTMFICGADAGAKRAVTGVLEKFGWEVEDLGATAAARAIEPLGILWCIPGFRRNRWTHAFKLLSK